jgi:hypothetical protein
LGVSLGVDAFVTSVRPEVVEYTVPIRHIPNFNLAGIPHCGKVGISECVFCDFKPLSTGETTIGGV